RAVLPLSRDGRGHPQFCALPGRGIRPFPLRHTHFGVAGGAACARRAGAGATLDPGKHHRRPLYRMAGGGRGGRAGPLHLRRGLPDRPGHAALRSRRSFSRGLLLRFVMASPDALIIGGGIVGAACARTLTEAGMQVLVLEAEFIGAGVTAAGMGHLVVMDDSEDQLALTQFSLRLWEELAPELPVEVEWDPCGTLWLAEDEAQLETVHRKQALYAQVGVATEVLDPTQLAAAEPSLRHGLAGALRVPGDRVIYPPAAARWLIEEATRAGAQLRERTRVHQIHPGGWVTLDSGERIAAGIIINAAGAAAASLTPGLPIVQRRGHLAIPAHYSGFCLYQSA